MTRIRIGVVGLLAAVLLAACGSESSPGVAGQPTVGQPSAARRDVSGLHRVYDTPRLIDGRPLTVFVGGQFCPFCASMRWPLVKALSRFGTFSGLGQILSRNGTDGFVSIASYDFAHASYRSDFITAHLLEVADVNGNPLQRLGPDDIDLVNRFDPNGSIPFVFVAGSYVAQLSYSPQLLAGKSFQQIQDDVNSSTPAQVGAAVNREADAITAAICKVDGARPASICQQPSIQALVQDLS